MIQAISRSQSSGTWLAREPGMSTPASPRQTPNLVPFPEAESRPGPSVKLLDRVRLAIRSRHYSRRTEQAYVHWIRRYIVFHDKKHPSTMGAPEIAKFLSWLATERRVSSSTQNQAFSAILFLYKHVLRIDVGAIEDVPRGKMPHRLPVVLSVEEVGTFIQQVQGTMWIVVALLYGAGLRLQECLELRVKDIDFDQHQIVVRRGKGQKDRVTLLPAAVEERLRTHLREVKALHARDLAGGFGRVVLPTALDRKVSEGGHRLGLAVRVSCGADLSGPTIRAAVPLSSARVCRPTGRGRRGSQGGPCEACRVPHHAPFVCDPLTLRWLRHSNAAGAARSCGCQYHDAVHTRAEPRAARCS